MKFGLSSYVVCVWICAAIVHAAAPIEVELATQQGLQITAPREWLQLMTSAGLDNVRIRGAAAGDEPRVVNRGTVERPRYYVLGVITSRNELRLPGGTFGHNDRAAIKDYFDRLTADGAEALTAPRGRFGLTEQELAAVFADLTQPIDFETKDQPPQKVLERLQSKLAYKLAIDAEAVVVLETSTPFADELQGVSSGTGVAMLLRNYGLVMRPEKQRGRPVTYRVATAVAASVGESTLGKETDKAPQQWPIGWEPDTAPVKLAPSLFAEINAQIDEGFTLADALAAIAPRVKIPFYFDHTALKANQIDPAKIQVKMARTRTSYKRVIDRVLAQARLGSQLRVDEAGTPFLWITR